MKPTRTTVALVLGLAASVPTAAQSPAPSPTVAPAPQRAPVAPAGGSTSGTISRQVAAAFFTADGAPVLPKPTTARTPQAGDAATRCARLSALLLEDVGRMLRFLGATDAETGAALGALRPFYGASFAARCATTPPEVLSCVESADNAFTGLADCGLNRGRAFADRLSLRPAVFDVPWNAKEGAVRDPAAAAALSAALVGTWEREGRETWSFSADGRATQTVFLSGEGPLVQSYLVTTTSGSRFFTTSPVGDNGGAPLGYRSAVLAGDTLYLQVGPDGMAQPIAASGPVIATERGYWLIHDIRGAPKCTGFNVFGQPAETVRCAWEGTGDARRLRIVAGFGHHLETGEPLPEATLHLREMSGYLVPADSGLRFYQRAQ